MTVDMRGASFRGVPFFVTGSEVDCGRRTVTHEYPQRDVPYVEDIGRATRTISLEAFLVGDDYLEQVKRLMAAVEEPGPGTLVHPWLGEMTVSLTASSSVKFDLRRKTASIALTAVESGELRFPTAKKDATSAAYAAVDNVKRCAVDRFADALDLGTASKFVDASLAGDLDVLLGFVGASELAKNFDASKRLADLASRGMSLISRDPRVFAETALNALGLGGFAGTRAAWSGVGSQLSNLTRSEQLNVGSARKEAAERGHVLMSQSRQAALNNRAALETLMRHALIAESVGVATNIGTKLDANPFDQNSTHSGRSYDELVQVRDEMLDAIEYEILNETDDMMYLALVDARAVVHRVITDRATEYERLKTVRPDDVFPALVLAYDYHDDATRDIEIARRNGVAREGFCPADDLKVLA